MIFRVSPVLLALNRSDPDARLERIEAFGSLVESFEIEPVFDQELFIGLRDVMPVPRRDDGSSVRTNECHN